ncbi:MAG: serine hydrolase domain-containing protein [Candidatus Cybelea sp.]
MSQVTRAVRRRRSNRSALETRPASRRIQNPRISAKLNHPPHQRGARLYSNVHTTIEPAAQALACRELTVRRRPAGRGRDGREHIHAGSVDLDCCAQADQSGCPENDGGRDGSQTPDSRRRGAPANTPGTFTVTYGTTQLGTTSPPTADTYFRIASNTKTMTAAVIVQLAQEGKLRFSDPVSKYVAGVPNGDHITIAELLEMRSGLYNYLEAPKIATTADHDMSKVWTPAELLAIAYNTNYILLGLIIEQIEGKTLAEAMRVRLFEPLGLRHTSLPPNNVTTLPKPYSHGYMYGSASVAFTGTPPYSTAVKAAARAGTLLPTDYTNLNTTFGWAAGGAISNANDCATWIQALVSGRVFDARYQERWISSLRPEDPKKPYGQRYGYGIIQILWGKNSIYYHGGETAGYNSFIGYDPANKVTLVVWTNLTVSVDEIPTANALMLKVLDQIYVVSPLTPTASSNASHWVARVLSTEIEAQPAQAGIRRGWDLNPRNP